MIRNILLVRNDRFGEFLLNIPAIRALKETFLNSRITLAVDKSVVELAKMIGAVDEVVVWDDSLRKGLRKMKFDLFIALNPTKEAHWAAFIAGISIRLGYDRKWGFLLTHKLEDTKCVGDRHEVDCNLELVNLIGAKTENKTIALDKLPIEGSNEYRGAIAVHPFTSDPVKQWPVERFMELANRIAREMKAKVVLVGKAEDRGQSPTGTVSSVNLVNKTSLVELAQVLKQCKLLVTCDSGPMHLAAVVGTPVIALFRNDLPGKNAKRWGPWGDGHTVIEKSKLEDISVDEALKAIRSVL